MIFNIEEPNVYEGMSKAGEKTGFVWVGQVDAGDRCEAVCHCHDCDRSTSFTRRF